MTADTKHLDYLQTAIGRMASQSFLVKGWSVTLAAAALGLAVKENHRAFALIGMLPVAILWWLDAYFLALERGFRGLYREAAERALRQQPPTFDMSPGAPRLSDVVDCAFRPVVLLAHGPLLITLIAASAML